MDFEKITDAFVKRAISSPADCKIAITEWRIFYDTLVEKLKERGMNTSQILNLVHNKLIGVCPDCHMDMSGQWLNQVAAFATVGRVILTGVSGMTHRFLKEGVCPNANCSCKEILVFWKPDEDRDAIERLAKMGIKIIPRF
jgi:hypothetical protein